MVRVVVLTNDKYQWCLKPFSYLFNIYWSAQQPVLVSGFHKPDFGLPDNFTYVSVDKENYPPDRWSDQLIKTLTGIDDDIICLLLEDYLLYRFADHGGIRTLADYMRMNPDILRMDLTSDRLYGHMMADVEPYGHYDIIACGRDAPYQMSLQAALWRRSLLLDILRPNRTSWETEIYTDMNHCPYRVMGTRQWPLRYSNLVYKGKVDMPEMRRVQMPHREVVENSIPSNWERIESHP